MEGIIVLLTQITLVQLRGCMAPMRLLSNKWNQSAVHKSIRPEICFRKSSRLEGSNGGRRGYQSRRRITLTIWLCWVEYLLESVVQGTFYSIWPYNQFKAVAPHL